jgi:hypothetical protein
MAVLSAKCGAWYKHAGACMAPVQEARIKLKIGYKASAEQFDAVQLLEYGPKQSA